DAKRHGVSVLPVSVQHSHWDCTLERNPIHDDGPAVRMGLRYVKGLHEADAQRLTAARAHGAFRSLDDFAARTQLTNPVMARLAESGALECFNDQRRGALWDALGV